MKTSTWTSIMKKQAIMWLAGVMSLGIIVLNSQATAWAISTLHIGFGDGTTCATGCGGDPNVYGGGSSDRFDIYQNSGGAGTATYPVLMIIGVPNETNANYFNHASIIDLISINTYPSGTRVGAPTNTWTYGTTAFGLNGAGYQGNFTSGEVYSDVLHLSGTNASNNFGNWHGADLTYNGIDAAGFGIYVFGLNADLGPHGLLSATFANNTTVPAGSFIISYAQNHDQNNNSQDYGTPFTESGLQRRVPEPSTLLLLACGIAGLITLRKRVRVRN